MKNSRGTFSYWDNVFLGVAEEGEEGGIHPLDIGLNFPSVALAQLYEKCRIWFVPTITSRQSRCILGSFILCSISQ